MDAARITHLLCPVCEKVVEDYAPGVSYVTIDGIEYHPHCAESMSANYRRKVEEILTAENGGTRQIDPLGKNPILDENEFVEMVEAYLLGLSAKDFAAKLAARDIGMAEALSDPCPDRAWPSAANE